MARGPQALGTSHSDPPLPSGSPSSSPGSREEGSGQAAASRRSNAQAAAPPTPTHPESLHQLGGQVGDEADCVAEDDVAPRPRQQHAPAGGQGGRRGGGAFVSEADPTTLLCQQQADQAAPPSLASGPGFGCRAACVATAVWPARGCAPRKRDPFPMFCACPVLCACRAHIPVGAPEGGVQGGKQPVLSPRLFRAQPGQRSQQGGLSGVGVSHYGNLHGETQPA